MSSVALSSCLDQLHCHNHGSRDTILQKRKRKKMMEATRISKNGYSSVSLYQVCITCIIFVLLLERLRRLNYSLSHRFLFGHWPLKKHIDKSDTHIGINRDGFAVDTSSFEPDPNISSETDSTSGSILLPPPLAVIPDLSIWTRQSFWFVLSASIHGAMVTAYLAPLPKHEKNLHTIMMAHMFGLGITACFDLVVIWAFLLTMKDISTLGADQWRRRGCSCQRLGDIHEKGQAKSPEGGR